MLAEAAKGNPIDQAMEILANAIPTWADDAPRVHEYITETGYDLAPVIATGNPTEIAKQLFTIHATTQLAQTNRQIKAAAQTMSSSGNSPKDPGPSDWDWIGAANPNIARVHLG